MSEIETPIGTLRCTLRAAKKINGLFGSIGAAIEKVGNLDLNAYIFVAAAGLGKDPDAVEDKVFTTGMRDLCAPMIEYLTMLSNGGRSLTNATKAAEDGAASGEA
jgi:hypothetical protein